VIDHIGVAVKSIEGALKFWEGSLGIQCTGVEEVAEQKVKTAFLPVKDTEIELLEATGDDSTVAKFIEKRGEGLHHVAIRVSNVKQALSELKEKGVRLIDETPRRGAGGTTIAFIHPSATGGILLELTER
jgi:methylmalonyl-CoA epimerase